MQNIKTLLYRELKEIFSSSFIYIIAAIFSFITGWLYYNYLISSQSLYKTTLTQIIIIPIFSNINFLMMFIIPFVTMRSFAEEKKQHTLELLFLSQLKDIEIWFAKFLSSLIVVLFFLLTTIIFPLILALNGYEDWGVVFACYVGTILSCCGYIAIGLFASSLTSSQFVASFLSFAMIFGITLLAISANATNIEILGTMFGYLSSAFHFEAFVRGAIKSYSFIYYFCFVFFFGFLTLKSLESRKW